jgi:hypothetical protein
MTAHIAANVCYATTPRRLKACWRYHWLRFRREYKLTVKAAANAASTVAAGLYSAREWRRSYALARLWLMMVPEVWK